MKQTVGSIPPKLHIWSPSFDPSAGGIQHLSKSIVDCLSAQATVKAISLPKEGSLLFRKLAFAARSLLHGLRDRPNAIVVMHRNFLGPAVWLKAVIGTKLLCWLHGIEAWDSRPNTLTGKVDHFIASSKFTLENSRHLMSKTAKADVVYPGIDFSAFSPAPPRPDLQQRYGLSSTDRVMITVARMPDGSAHKGQDHVIRALPAVAEACPEVKYVVVGTGPGRKTLEKLAKQSGVSERVIFTGRIPTAHLITHYQLAKVFVMPSSGEGFGIAYIEALACGCHVIGGESGASPETLAEGLGECVSPGRMLEEAIARALQSPQQPNLRDDASKRYGIPAFQESLERTIASS